MGVQGWRVVVVCVPGHRQSAFGRAVVAVVGGCVGGIATIGLRRAGDTPWRGVYGSKTPRWRGRVAVGSANAAVVRLCMGVARGVRVLRCCSGAGLAVVGGWVGGIATIGLRRAGDTPWRGVYGSKTPRWRGRVAVAEPRLVGARCGRVWPGGWAVARRVVAECGRGRPRSE